MALEHILAKAEAEPNPILLGMYADIVALAMHNGLLTEADLKYEFAKCPRLVEEAQSSIKTMGEKEKMNPRVMQLQLVGMQRVPGGLAGEIAYEIYKHTTHRVK